MYLLKIVETVESFKSMSENYYFPMVDFYNFMVKIQFIYLENFFID